MKPFGHFLERWFERGQGWLTDLSMRWREHTNRRTIVVVVAVGAIAAYGYLSYVRPPDSFPVDVLVSVPEGASVRDVGATLADQHVLRSPLVFRVLVKLMGDDRTLHAGDYLFKEPLDVFSVARAIAIGQYGLEPQRVRIPEGATRAEMARLFSKQLERFNAGNFIAQTKNDEGYLFPDTYFFLPNATEDTVVQAMRQNFDIQIEKIRPQIASSSRSLHDIVIMASILEREAYNTQDRRMISGILWNRIKKGMPLQVDAAFAYTIGKGTFQLTVKDLASDDPYNTYRFKGLPPTAIGSPSLDSLQAAADPIKNDNLYFLADHNGVTHYCKTYACHVANKNLYF